MGERYEKARANAANATCCCERNDGQKQTNKLASKQFRASISKILICFLQIQRGFADSEPAGKTFFKKLSHRM